MAPRRTVLLAFEGAQVLDLTGPQEVLDTAERLRPGSYAIEVATPDGEPFTTSSGLRVMPDRALPGPRARIDTLIVAGGGGVSAQAADPEVVATVRGLASRARRVTSVCTGAFLLAAAGLLDGRRAATHWAGTSLLAEQYPEVRVDPDPIYVRDGHVWTSAGVTAGIDLTLALVEEDLGAEVALEVARWLVVFAKRPGGQAQFSTALAAQTATRFPLREAQDHVRAHPDADLSVEALARRAGMSTRHFSRAFRAETSMTPAAFVEGVRVERAAQMLESTGLGIEAIATACGFGTPETLRRTFNRRLGVSPGQYRERFHVAA